MYLGDQILPSYVGIMKIYTFLQVCNKETDATCHLVGFLRVFFGVRIDTTCHGWWVFFVDQDNVYHIYICTYKAILKKKSLDALKL